MTNSAESTFSPEVDDLAQSIETSHRTAVSRQTMPILPAQRDHEIPLGLSQERVWFLQQLAPTSTAYYFLAAIEISGPLNIQALQSSLGEMVQRHEILRTTFAESHGWPIQVVHNAPEVALPVIFGDHPEGNCHDASVAELIQKEAAKKFDFRCLPLVRWVLFRLSHDRHVLLHLQHHLIHDDWSFHVFLGELFKTYQAFSTGRPCPLPPVRIQFGDFAFWQRKFLASQEIHRQIAYWEKQLAGSLLVTELPMDRPRPQAQSFKGTVIRLTLPLPLSQAARAFSNKHRTSLFATMLSAFAAITYRYTQQNDLCIGSSVANRQHPDTENLLGMLGNNVVLRAQVSGEGAFLGLLSQIHALIVDATENQDVPFQTVIQRLNVERNLRINPGFQLMFSFQHSPVTVPEMPELKLKLAEGLGNGGAKFDISVIVVPSSVDRRRLNPEWHVDELTMLWEYNTDLFDENTLLRMAGHYKQLLENAIVDPELQVAHLGLLSAEERKQLLLEHNQTQAEYSWEKSVSQLFEERVLHTPHAIAVEYEDQQLTYAELNQRANQLAHYLRKQGAGPEVLVGICVERGLDMAVSLMATLKSGAAYVPLDPIYPAERIGSILEDAQVRLLLTMRSLFSLLPDYSGVAIALDQEWSRISRESAVNPASNVLPENLAYVIFTSGSTGKPKGVQISHRALVNFLTSMMVEPRIYSEDIMLAVTTLSFDIAGLELYLPLVSGARVRILGREACVDGLRLLDEVNKGATILQGTPTTWLLLLEAGWSGNAVLKVLCGGEALSPELAGKLASRACSVWNLYGPTETTIYSLMERIEKAGEKVLIGRPIANTQAYVLDEQMSPSPVGLVGELYLGGDGLARGYQKRSDLTAERFVPNPFSTTGGERLYRTGDWARYMANGKIECLGRMDFQVKVHGYRIELGEVESALLEHPAVERAVVMVRNNRHGDKQLVGYLVPGKNQTINTNELLAFISKKLPRYMVPTQFLLLNEMPLTPNGKIDRKALPEVSAQDPDLPRQYVAPRTPLETVVAEMWLKFCRLIVWE